MFSFFIGLAIALLITVAGFGGFLFKLSNSDTSGQPLEGDASSAEHESSESLYNAEAEANANLNPPLSKPDFNSGNY